jgi:inosine-uridine nucleoside N-ribohydrolase
MSTPTLLLDCDPGHDDAIAIMLAAQAAKLHSVVTVNGNVSLELTTYNALMTTQILNLDVPVYAGANRPLLAPLYHAPDIHGETGLGGPVLPPCERNVASHDGVWHIVKTFRERSDIELVATGPLTNIALALRLAPDIASHIPQITLMGGSNSFGNRTPVAEFNILADPEAAAIVFEAGIPIKMLGLNLTHQFLIDEATIADMRKLRTTAGTFVADMLEFFGTTYAERYFGQFFAPLHDPCAILALTHPELITFEPRHVAVELTGTHTRGMTVVDERQVMSDLTANAEVGITIDRDAAISVLMTALASYR